MKGDDVYGRCLYLCFCRSGRSGHRWPDVFRYLRLTQRAQARAQQLAHKVTRREELYKAFIDEASKLYADSLVHETPDVSQLVRLYSMISLMRMISATRIVQDADKVLE